MRRLLGIQLALISTSFVVLTACNGLGPSTTPIDTDADTEGRDGDTSDTDTTDPDPDTNDPDPDTTDPDPDTDTDPTPGGCVTVTVSPDLSLEPEGFFVASITSPALGGAGADVLFFEFFDEANGTFTLGSGLNSNYSSCEQCLTARVDVDGDQTTALFARSGTIAVTGSPSGPELSLGLSGVELEEVVISDDGTFTSTPVPGGGCIALESPLLLGTGECEPNCFGQECGDDGCGGSCGTCADGDICSSEGTCDSLECEALTVEDDLVSVAGNQYIASIDALNAVGADLLQLEFYTSATGTIDLGSVVNSNYNSCEQCVRVFESASDRQWLQAGGTLIVNDDPQDGSVNAVLNDATLIEVTIAADGSFTSTPVPGGECVALPSSITLVADAVDVGECEAFTPPSALTAVATNAYLGEFAAAGTAGIDAFQIEFYAATTGTVDLGAAGNASYATCNQCVRAFAGDTSQYFQSGGTIDIADNPQDASLNATITDGALIEVTVDPVSFETTPVAGGECLELPASITFTGQ